MICIRSILMLLEKVICRNFETIKLKNMDKKSFIFGVICGIALTLVILIFVSFCQQRSRSMTDEDSFKMFEVGTSYEKKMKTSFKVFQVFGDYSLANEFSEYIGDNAYYDGNTVLLCGTSFYTDQVVVIESPKIVGTFSYETKGGRRLTVPIVEGEIAN